MLWHIVKSMFWLKNTRIMFDPKGRRTESLKIQGGSKLLHQESHYVGQSQPQTL
jgi:hypothetical protein